jgi:hypothetical protein
MLTGPASPTVQHRPDARNIEAGAGAVVLGRRPGPRAFAQPTSRAKNIAPSTVAIGEPMADSVIDAASSACGTRMMRSAVSCWRHGPTMPKKA